MMRRNVRKLTVCIVLLTCLNTTLASGDNSSSMVPYTATKLSSTTFLCKANRLAAGGFWRNEDGTVSEGARAETEKHPTFWKVFLSIDTAMAQVIRFNGNNEELTSPESFRIEVTPPGGILLVSERQSGASPQTITIDPINSSFVYSSQHVNSMWNRVNIWYGSCRPA